VATYFNGQIRENPAVVTKFVDKNGVEHLPGDKNSMFTVNTKNKGVYNESDLREGSTKPKEGAMPTSFVVTTTFTHASGARKLIGLNNYIALNKYVLRNVNESITVEEADSLNASTFGGLWATRANKPVKWNALRPSQQTKIYKEGERIISTYITADAKVREQVTVEAWHDKNIKVPLELPIRDSNAKTKSFLKHSLLDENGSRNLAQEYPIIAGIMGQALDVESIRETHEKHRAAKAKSGASTRDLFDGSGGEAAIVIKTLQDMKRNNTDAQISLEGSLVTHNAQMQRFNDLVNSAKAG
jgi:hypothetical protein